MDFCRQLYYMLGTAILYGFNLFYIYASICINAADQGVDICGIVLNFVVDFWDLTFFFIQWVEIVNLGI